MGGSARSRTRPGAAAIAGAAALLLVGCSAGNGSQAGASDGLTTVTFALSYLPDPSLNGLAVAIDQGLFAAEGIEVEILPWGATTPESLVAAGEADLGFATDIRTSLLAQASGGEFTSLMAVYQHTPYDLTVLTSGDVDRPADLAGGTYGGFGSPMEIAVVNDMIAADGGAGTAEAVTLSTAAFEALSSERVDSVLSFPGDIYALERAGTPVTTWSATDFGLPDGYASLVIAGDAYRAAHPDLVAGFVSAMQAGYAAALEDPAAADEAVLAMYPDDLESEQTAFVSQIQTERLYVSPSGVVGAQDPEVWQANADWLAAKGLLTDASGEPLTELDTTDLFTDEYLRD